MLHSCNMSGVVSDKRTDEPTLTNAMTTFVQPKWNGEYINSQLIQQVLHIQDT